MTLANCPAECEHCAPCLADLYEMADDMASFTYDPNWRNANQPAQQSTTEEIQ